MLTAAAAMLAMIPLTRSELWGPMAMAIMGGLLVATVLTVLFVPALYAAWYRVRRPAGAPTVAAGAAQPMWQGFITRVARLRAAHHGGRR
jgi:hypothetical protein